MKTLFVLLIVVAVVTAEGPAGHGGDEKGGKGGHTDHPHWTYAQRGADWKEGVCATGKAQSPIDVQNPTALKPDDKLSVSYNYQPITELHLVNNGHTVQGGPEKTLKGALQFGGAWYDLVQFHFHTTSEHTVKGQAFNAEIHLVHKKVGSENELLVLGVMFKDGTACSPLWDQLNVKAWPQKKDEKITVKNIDLKSLTNTIAKGGPLFAYKGSLTTPPCTENVEWRVFQAVEPICPQQVQVLLKAVGTSGNARKTQPLNNRVISTAKATFLATRSGPAAPSAPAPSAPGALNPPH